MAGSDYPMDTKFLTLSDTVRRWELEDDSLETAMKTGELPEPEETK